MAQFNVGKKSVHDKANSEQVKHKHVPGKAYNIDNPVDKLINMIGGGFFNEPRYYGSNQKDEVGLTPQAKEIVETAKEVARGEYEGAEPDDLLVIAAWARDTKSGLKLRTTPQVLCAIGSNCARSRSHVPRYAEAIMPRPDDAIQTFAAYRSLFHRQEDGMHKGSLPHALRRALRKVFSKYSEYQILKYNKPNIRPNIADVVLMINGSVGKPLSKGMFEYIVNDKIVDNAPDVLLARKELFAKNDISEVTPDLLKRAKVTWENVSSKFGDKTEGTKPEVWELVIPFMNEMALVRNLRNFEKAGISKDAWETVNEKLLNVEQTTQLPFRFFTAESMVESPDAKDVCEIMLDRAVANLPELHGVTAVFNDNSGSAVSCSISRDRGHKSDAPVLTVSDAGNMLGAVAAKRYGQNVKLGVFGDSFIWVDHNPEESCLQIKKNMDRIAQVDDRSKHNALGINSKLIRKCPGVGGGTETGLWFGIQDLIDKKIKVDRIVLCSDLCCYTQGDVNCGIDLKKYFGPNATVQGMIDKYKAAVNPDVKVYSVNLSGYSQAQTRSDENSHRISGWSENIFKMISDLENPQQEGQEEQKSLPTLAVLRKQYKK